MKEIVCKISFLIVVIFIVSFHYHDNASKASEISGWANAESARYLALNTSSDSTMTEQEYLASLHKADAETFKRNFEKYFLLLLNSGQKKAYESHKLLKEKKAYMQLYWKASNPNPLLPENDWLLEFNRRVQYAKENFRHTKPPYVDDRGKYYIKYGKPQRRHEDPGGILRVKFTNNERARKYFGLISPVNYTALANETWSYENVNHNFVVHFVKEGLSFREVDNLMEILEDKRAIQKSLPIFLGNPLFKGDPDMIFWLWADMVKKRMAVSPALARAAGEIMRIEESITVFDHGIWQLDEYPQKSLRLRSHELTTDIKLTRARTPAAAHDPIQAENKLEFFDQIAQFRGPGGRTRIDIALIVPFKKNLVKKFKKSSKDTLDVEFSGMLRDSNFESIIKNHSSASLQVKLAALEKLPNAVGTFALLTKPQNTELTLQVEEKKRKKIGFYRQPLQIRDFSGRALMISDIQLNYEVKYAAQKNILPTLQQQDLLVSPYPYEEISRKKPPLVYFEIYNIRTAGINENIQISYTITRLKEKGNVLALVGNLFSRSEKTSVSVTFSRPVTGENMQELIGIDLKNVKKGWHLLEVTASSLQDSTITATVEKKLFVNK